MPYRKRRPVARRRPVRRPAAAPRSRKLVRKPKYARATYVEPIGMSPATFVKLKFSDIYTFSNNGLALESYQFRGNGPFDPQVTAGGGSCPYFSNYAALYSNLVCYGSKIAATFTNSSAQSVNALVWAAPQATIFPTQIIDVIEQAGVKPKILANTGAGGSVKTISQYRKTSYVLGVPKAAIDISPDYQSTVSGTPNRQFYWNVCTQTVDESTNATVRVRVDITYYCKFIRPVPTFVS